MSRCDMMSYLSRQVDQLSTVCRAQSLKETSGNTPQRQGLALAGGQSAGPSIDSPTEMALRLQVSFAGYRQVNLSSVTFEIHKGNGNQGAGAKDFEGNASIGARWS
jgi:hypothetical protein